MFYVPAFIFMWILDEWRKGRIPVIGSKWGIWVVVIPFLILMVAGGFYFFQYAVLVYERRANNIPIDFVFGGIIFVAVINRFVAGVRSGCPAGRHYFYSLRPDGAVVARYSASPGLNFLRILRISIVEIDGIYGFLPSSGINLVIIFIFYASVVAGFGGLDYIVDVTRSVTKRFSNGIPQVAVVSSLIFGLFSGSGTANAAGVGGIYHTADEKVWHTAGDSR